MTPIFIEEPITWKQIEVPPPIVKYCKEFTFLDPEKDKDNLRLEDCYRMHMGYHGISAEIMYHQRLDTYKNKIPFKDINPIFE
jgi:hypothetical protein